jgi:Xaa-Pro aminopeptidase
MISSTTPIIRADGVPLREYAQRREQVLKLLKGGGGAGGGGGGGAAAAVIFAGDLAPGATAAKRPDLNFLYLTGIETEGGAAILFDPSQPNPKRRIALFLRPLNPEADRWDGYRDEISSHLRSTTGFDFVGRTTMLPMFLAGAARRLKRLASLHSLASHTAEVSPDLAVFRKVSERVPGTAIEDRSMLLPTMRSVKSAAEINLMKRAAEATAAGYTAAMKAIRPGVTEAQVQRAMEAAFIENGAEGTAYGSIVGGGVNATVLHYERNSQPLEDGEVLLIDAGAQVAGYACDVTRAFPVSGKFTPEQRALYEVVLKAELAAIRAARPGKYLWQVDEAAREVIDAAGYADFFPHGTSHHLGLHVHDADPDAPLAAGMVITIEPGVYLPEKKLGIRIEDDVLITRDGPPKVLTAEIPKTVEEIERGMKRK